MVVLPRGTDWSLKKEPSAVINLKGQALRAVKILRTGKALKIQRYGERTGLQEVYMKFGGFYEHQLSLPWTESSNHTLLQNTLEQVELSDRMGFDYV
mgnify:CR=1 FL=1|jgi:hypothetical protein